MAQKLLSLILLFSLIFLSSSKRILIEEPSEKENEKEHENKEQNEEEDPCDSDKKKMTQIFQKFMNLKFEKKTCLIPKF